MTQRIRVLFVAHDAYRAGATIFLLNMLRWLKQNSDLYFEVAVREHGEMVQHFAELAPTHVLKPPIAGHGVLRRIRRRLGELRTISKAQTSTLAEVLEQGQFDVLYLNTMTLGDQLASLAKPTPAVITHVHELPSAIRRHGRGKADLVVNDSSALICVSEIVRSRLVDEFPVAKAKARCIYGFVPVKNPPLESRKQLHQRLLTPLGIEFGAWVIGLCGHGYVNKGVDLLVPLATLVPSSVAGRAVHFVWVGAESTEYPHETAMDEARRAEVELRVHFPGKTDQSQDWMACFDVHLMLSREDSFPLVVMEAAALEVPTLAFDRAGGAVEFIGTDAGRCVPYLNLQAMAIALMELLNDHTKLAACGTAAKRRVLVEHSPDAVLPQVNRLIHEVARADRKHGSTDWRKDQDSAS